MIIIREGKEIELTPEELEAVNVEFVKNSLKSRMEKSFDFPPGKLSFLQSRHMTYTAGRIRKQNLTVLSPCMRTKKIRNLVYVLEHAKDVFLLQMMSIAITDRKIYRNMIPAVIIFMQTQSKRFSAKENLRDIITLIIMRREWMSFLL